MVVVVEVNSEKVELLVVVGESGGGGDVDRSGSHVS